MLLPFSCIKYLPTSFQDLLFSSQTSTFSQLQFSTYFWFCCTNQLGTKANARARRDNFSHLLVQQESNNNLQISLESSCTLPTFSLGWKNIYGLVLLLSWPLDKRLPLMNDTWDNEQISCTFARRRLSLPKCDLLLSSCQEECCLSNSSSCKNSLLKAEFSSLKKKGTLEEVFVPVVILDQEYQCGGSGRTLLAPQQQQSISVSNF